MFGYLRDESIHIKELYTIYKMHLPQKHTSGRESYDFWELVYVIDGELNTTVGNSVYTLPKGSFILYEPFEFHTMSVGENGFADIFILTFSVIGPTVSKLKLLPFALDGSLKGDMLRIIDLCAQNSTAEKVSFTPNPQAFYFAYHQSLLKEPLFMPKLCALTEFFLLNLCDVSTEKISSVNTHETMMFFDFTEDMKKHKDRFLTIEELSKLNNVSPTKAKSLIKKYSGLSLHKYYLGVKISQAFVLFRQGYNISQVSQELGFCNSNYFSAVFKRETGETPSQYLKKLKEVY